MVPVRPVRILRNDATSRGISGTRGSCTAGINRATALPRRRITKDRPASVSQKFRQPGLGLESASLFNQFDQVKNGEATMHRAMLLDRAISRILTSLATLTDTADNWREDTKMAEQCLR